MATAVGLWIGAATSTAAIVRGNASDTDAPEFVERDTEFVERETVLYTTEDGSTTLGVAPDAPLARTATGFIDMVGNPDGIVLDDGVAYRAEDLLATGVFCLIEDCPADVDPDTASLALAHPRDWTSETVTAVIESLNYLGLRSVSLVPIDAAPTSSGHTPARLAALDALAAAPFAGDVATEQFAAVPAPEKPTSVPWTMVDAPAYSAVTDPLRTPLAPVATSTVVPAARPAAQRRGRAPMLVAVGAAAAFALVGGAIAVAMGEYSETAVPPITNAEAPPPTTTSTTTHAPPAGPIAFPTVPTTVEQYVAPPVVEVAQVATTTAAPPPPVETTQPPPEATEAPTTTEPPATTTEPTTTEPSQPAATTEPTAPTEPTTTVETPTTTTEPAANGRVQSGTVFTGTLQPTLLEEMPSFDDSDDGSSSDIYPPARPHRDDAE